MGNETTCGPNGEMGTVDERDHRNHEGQLQSAGAGEHQRRRHNWRQSYGWRRNQWEGGRLFGVLILFSFYLRKI